MIKKKLGNREDVEDLVNTFYRRIFEDEQIGHIFTEVVDVEWEVHFPIMYDFWESVLFGSGLYKGNPILKHIKLNEKIALSDAHFDRWMSLWKDTIHTLFDGEKALEAIAKAQQMRTLMQFKIKQSQNSHFIQ